MPSLRAGGDLTTSTAAGLAALVRLDMGEARTSGSTLQMANQNTLLTSPSAEERVWRIKAVTDATPDALARALTLLETQDIVPRRLVAQRAPVRGLAKMVLEIEIEVAAADFASGAFAHFVAILAELPRALSVVVPDPAALRTSVNRPLTGDAK